MKLKSFGCSFIFGTDLSDDGRNGPYATGSFLTWPSLIAKNFGYEYATYARPGSGNLQILERLLSQIDPGDPALYVIGWTWIDRFDYVDPGLVSPWPGTKWKTLMPIDETPTSRIYYKNLHCEYSDKLTTLIYINTAVEALRRNNCRFIMTYMDDLIFHKKWHTTIASESLLGNVEHCLTNFEGKNFLEWSKDKGFAISPTSHPLEQSHQAAADHIISNWQNFIRS